MGQCKTSHSMYRLRWCNTPIGWERIVMEKVYIEPAKSRRDGLREMQSRSTATPGLWTWCHQRIQHEIHENETVKY